MGHWGYFKFGNYCDNIVDIIIVATAKALHIKLYQKEPDGNMQVIEQTTDAGGREVYLNIMWNPSNKYYDTILLFDKSGQLLDKDRPSPTR